MHGGLAEKCFHTASFRTGFQGSCISVFFLYHAVIIELFGRGSVSLRFTISYWNFVDILHFDCRNTCLCLTYWLLPSTQGISSQFLTVVFMTEVVAVFFLD